MAVVHLETDQHQHDEAFLKTLKRMLEHELTIPPLNSRFEVVSAPEMVESLEKLRYRYERDTVDEETREDPKLRAPELVADISSYPAFGNTNVIAELRPLKGGTLIASAKSVIVGPIPTVCGLLLLALACAVGGRFYFSGRAEQAKMRAAERFEERENLDQALAMVEQVIQQSPNHVEAIELRQRIFSRRVQSYIKRGVRKLERGMLGEAEIEFSKALDIDAENQPARDGLDRVHEARRALSHFETAQTALENGRLDTAAKDLRSVLPLLEGNRKMDAERLLGEIDRRKAEAEDLVRKTRVLKAEWKIDEAVEAVNAALSAFPEHREGQNLYKELTGMSAPMKAAILEWEGGREVVLLAKNAVTIGRAEENDIFDPEDSKDTYLSRRHAKIEFTDGLYRLIDLSSTFGTYFEGAKIESPTVLSHSGEILFGTNFKLSVRILTESDVVSSVTTTSTIGGRQTKLQALALSEKEGGRKPFREWVMVASSFTIGRGKDNGIVLADSSVSEHHARIDYQDGHFWIQDLGSRNGTYVRTGPERIQEPQRLMGGDHIRLGRISFHLKRRA
ncbi:MAG: FHA domain-containing protein [Nitrospirae bacterium]|nr:FHA domain-containing protein [Nitrospirota bacterium]